MDRFMQKPGSDRGAPASTGGMIEDPRTAAVSSAVPYATPFATPFEDEEGNHNLALEYYRTLLRHRFLVILLAAGGVLASILLHLATQPVYRTRTSLDIQSLNGDFMDMRSLDPTVGASSSDTNLQTQIKLLQSDSLMEHVRQRLTDEAHPPFVARNDLLSRLERAFDFDNGSAIPFQALLEETARGVKVKPLGVTRLIEVTCDSWDADFAARFCNTLTSEFQSEDLESRGLEAKRTSDWLMHQAADIRQKAQDAEQRLIAATGGNGLILSQESDSVGEDRLRQMQAELVKAQADRIEKEAEATVASAGTPDSGAGVLDSSAYATSQAKLADLEASVAALVPPLTEENPRVIHLRSEIQEVERTMGRERATSAQGLENEYAAAKHREALLTRAYQAQEASVSSDLQKGSKVNLLRREMESEQQLYETLLQRAKEAGFASAMQASTIRVVDTARKPRLAVYPQRLTAAAVGLVLGSLAGLGIAFFKDRNTAVLRMPGESKRFLQIEELGVIPSPVRASLFSSKTNGALTVLDDLAKPGDHAALRTARWDDNVSLVAEAYRNTTMSLLLSSSVKQGKIYVISSPSAGDGKTTVTSNLGVALSKTKLRVVLIDGDLRKPSLHRAMSVSNEVGLRDILRGEVDLTSPSISGFCKATAFPKLFVIPSGEGQEQVVELLHSAHFGELLNRLSREFDLILVDTPPMLHIADARIFAQQAHGAILILRSGVTTRTQAIDARDVLDRDRVQVVGTILNDFNPGKEGNYGYYKSYYAYQGQTDPDKKMAVGL